MKKLLIIFLIGFEYIGHSQNKYLSTETYYNYENGLEYLIKDSTLLTGTIYWENNEKIIKEENYINGVKNGLQKKWMKNGQLWTKEIYNKGMFRLYESYFENGSINKQIKVKKKATINRIGYKVNRKDLVYNEPRKVRKEVVKEWDINKNILSKHIHYDNQGCYSHKKWYTNGQIKLRGVGYVENWLKMKMWYENGKLKEEYSVIKWTNYSPGVDINGKEWHTTGSPIEGYIKYYHENGQLKNERYYNEGKLINDKCWNKEGEEMECEY